jgi:tetratricopeptide (TPR) repeat protein
MSSLTVGDRLIVCSHTPLFHKKFPLTGLFRSTLVTVPNRVCPISTSWAFALLALGLSAPVSGFLPEALAQPNQENNPLAQIETQAGEQFPADRPLPLGNGDPSVPQDLPPAVESAGEPQHQPKTETYDYSMTKGLILFGKGKYDQAEELFQRALDAVPEDLDALDYLGQTQLRLKKYEAAEKTFRQSLAVRPFEGRALLGLGIAQASLGKDPEAQETLKAAEIASPDNPLIYYYQGLVAQNLKAYDRSPALFSRAMALSPDLTPASRYYTGISHYQRGLLDEAQREFEAAIAGGEPESELARSAREFLQQQRAVPKGPRPWDLSVSVSGQYDSNVVLLPGGTQPPNEVGISRKHDYVAAFYVRGEYRPIQTNLWMAGVTYGFYQSLHNKLTLFNVQDHSPTLFVQRQVGPVSFRMQYVFDYTKVGNLPYLVSNAIQPIITIAEEGNTFTQVQLRYQNKDFKDDLFTENSARDARNWLAGLTQIFSSADGASNFRVGYTFDMDRTGGGQVSVATPGVQTNADWAYRGHRLSIGGTGPAVLSVTPSLELDYYLQNYDNANSFSPDGTTRRRDRIIFFTGSLSKDLTDSLTLSLEYNYTRDQSNVSVFDYTRSIYSITLSGHF